MDTELTVFRKLVRIVRNRANVSLRPGREAAFVARLHQRMSDLRLRDFEEYVTFLEDRVYPHDIVQFVRAIGSHDRFLRTGASEGLHDMAAGWIAEGKRVIRIRSAVSAFADEPSGIATVLHEVYAGACPEARLVPSDIPPNGDHDTYALEPLPQELVGRYFESSGAVRESLRKTVAWKPLRLDRPPFPATGPLDALFCRSVMTFRERTEFGLVSELVHLLGPLRLQHVGQQ